MQGFTTFHIVRHSYDADSRTASFVYRFDDAVTFTEQLLLPDFGDIAVEDIERVLFHVGIALGTGYYKLFPTATIVVHSGSLTDQQKAFRQTFYLQGLGEFFYTNNLDPNGLANFEATGSSIAQVSTTPSSGYLVPMGGGKDSTVAISLLKEAGYGDQIMLYTNGKDYSVHEQVAAVAELPRVVTQRTLDPQLFAMNKQGYYNGHVPITGIISFISLLVALGTDRNQIVFSNEWSANFGNTNWKGMNINHQRSKGYAFEQAFVDYLHQYISDEIDYFSLLRPRHELRIAKEMSHLTDYFSVFTSCNQNFKITGPGPELWCGECPKCHFTYLILRPFLTRDQVVQIRGREYYADPDLLSSFKQLRGVAGIKPFECVGTYEESQVATRMVCQDEDIAELAIVEWFVTHLLPSKTSKERAALRDRLLAPEEVGLTNIPEQLRTLIERKK